MFPRNKESMLLINLETLPQEEQRSILNLTQEEQLDALLYTAKLKARGMPDLNILALDPEQLRAQFARQCVLEIKQRFDPKQQRRYQELARNFAVLVQEQGLLGVLGRLKNQGKGDLVSLEYILLRHMSQYMASPEHFYAHDRTDMEHDDGLLRWMQSADLASRRRAELECLAFCHWLVCFAEADLASAPAYDLP